MDIRAEPPIHIRIQIAFHAADSAGQRLSGVHIGFGMLGLIEMYFDSIRIWQHAEHR
jgi:hypothetical protein